jgi:hypothetical protein
MNKNIKGEFNLIVLDSEGKVKQDTGYFDNLILDSFLTTLQSSATLTSFFPNAPKDIAVGTGTTAPSPTQTTLVSVVARISGGQAGSSSYSESGLVINGNNWSASATMTFTFGLGQVVATLSEVGFALPSVASPNVNSRTLIVNESQVPTSVIVTAQDQLIVNYRLTISGTDTDGSGTVSLGGQNYNWISRRGTPASNPVGEMLTWNTGSSTAYAASNAVFGVAGVDPTGTSSAVNSTLINGTIAGQRSRRVNAGINDANLSGGIKCILVGDTKFEFTPAIPKDASKILNLDVAYNFTRT